MVLSLSFGAVLRLCLFYHPLPLVIRGYVNWAMSGRQVTIIAMIYKQLQIIYLPTWLIHSSAPYI